MATVILGFGQYHLPHHVQHLREHGLPEAWRFSTMFVSRVRTESMTPRFHSLARSSIGITFSGHTRHAVATPPKVLIAAGRPFQIFGWSSRCTSHHKRRSVLARDRGPGNRTYSLSAYRARRSLSESLCTRMYTPRGVPQRLDPLAAALA